MTVHISQKLNRQNGFKIGNNFIFIEMGKPNVESYSVKTANLILIMIQYGLRDIYFVLFSALSSNKAYTLRFVTRELIYELISICSVPPQIKDWFLCG